MSEVSLWIVKIFCGLIIVAQVLKTVGMVMTGDYTSEGKVRREKMREWK